MHIYIYTHISMHYIYYMASQATRRTEGHINIFICVYSYICVCVYIYTHIYSHMHILKCIHIYIHIYYMAPQSTRRTESNTNIHIYLFITHTHTYIYIYTWIYVYILWLLNRRGARRASGRVPGPQAWRSTWGRRDAWIFRKPLGLTSNPAALGLKVPCSY